MDENVRNSRVPIPPTKLVKESVAGGIKSLGEFLSEKKPMRKIPRCVLWCQELLNWLGGKKRTSKLGHTEAAIFFKRWMMWALCSFRGFSKVCCWFFMRILGDFGLATGWIITVGHRLFCDLGQAGMVKSAFPVIFASFRSMQIHVYNNEMLNSHGFFLMFVFFFWGELIQIHMLTFPRG